MFQAIRQFFDRHVTPPPEPAKAGATTPHAEEASLALAACALLLELAHADDEFTDDERRHIVEALDRHFDVPPEAAEDLMRLADQERQRAVDLYQFTSLINQSYDEGQRMVLAEVMWGLVYADQELASHESYLLRKLSSLLELRPGYLAEARKRALGTNDAGAD
jgi:uncharacterized tellurite resistance protein B-like protein